MEANNYDERMLALENMMAEVLAILKQDKPNVVKHTDVACKKPKDQDKPKKSKKVKQDQDEPKKKRGPTGYLLFSGASRADVKAALEEAEESTNPKDVTRELARRWKELSDDERDEWNDKAKQLKDSDSEE
tara:strand:+ start:129 stop:521 length:393 start_codon:yes stop_codon:yes gene_type:complete